MNRMRTPTPPALQPSRPPPLSPPPRLVSLPPSLPPPSLPSSLPPSLPPSVRPSLLPSLTDEYVIGDRLERADLLEPDVSDVLAIDSLPVPDELEPEHLGGKDRPAKLEHHLGTTSSRFERGGFLSIGNFRTGARFRIKMVEIIMRF